MRPSMKPAEAPKKNNQPFNETTGYKIDYQAKELPPRFKHNAPEYSPCNAPFDDLTTTKRDYDEKKAEKMNNFRPDNNAYSSSAPFDGNTIQKIDYQKWPTEKPYSH